jgi:hypothetical protein
VEKPFIRWSKHPLSDCFWPRLCENTKMQKSVVILFAIFLGTKPKVEIQQASPEGALPKWRAVPLASNLRTFSHSLGRKQKFEC